MLLVISWRSKAGDEEKASSQEGFKNNNNNGNNNNGELRTSSGNNRNAEKTNGSRNKRLWYEKGRNVISYIKRQKKWKGIWYSFSTNILHCIFCSTEGQHLAFGAGYFRLKIIIFECLTT